MVDCCLIYKVVSGQAKHIILIASLVQLSSHSKNYIVKKAKDPNLLDRQWEVGKEEFLKIVD